MYVHNITPVIPKGEGRAYKTLHWIYVVTIHKNKNILS